MFSVKTLDGRMSYFTSAITIWQLLEELLKEIKGKKVQRKGINGVRNEDTKINHSPLNFNGPLPLVSQIKPQSSLHILPYSYHPHGL
jgi:hypothetical protein